VGGRRRIAAARFRANKNKALIAAERKNRLNLDRNTALAAKNYREANFAAEKDRKFDTARFNKAKIAALAREAALRKNIRLGGGIWKRQFDEAGESGGLDIGSDDSIDSPDSIDSDSSSSPLIDSDADADADNFDESPSSPDSSRASPDLSRASPSSTSSSPNAVEGGGVDSDAAVDQDGLGFGGGFGGLYGGGLSGGFLGGGDFYGGGGFGGIGGIDILDNEGNSNDNEVGPSSIGDNSYAAASPEFDQFSPSSAGLDAEDVPQESNSNPVTIDQAGASLTKRSFGHGGFPRFRKNTRLRNAKILKLVALENARRRKALNRTRVKFNTKKFNELKFKNNSNLKKDNKAKVVALKDRKNIAAAKLRKVGGGFF
ncbi:uncharacterized protein JCM6883_004819, partial [Sporobolomyces salmoneus]|uniref:uncharacterized protein n=1 Tax=Sporobolomyces salmoneus TaxID=183962 RepID=UPI003175BD01